jgi:hypothetical protein
MNDSGVTTGLLYVCCPCIFAGFWNVPVGVQAQAIDIVADYQQLAALQNGLVLNAGCCQFARRSEVCEK